MKYGTEKNPTAPREAMEGVFICDIPFCSDKKKCTKYVSITTQPYLNWYIFCILQRGWCTA